MLSTQLSPHVLRDRWTLRGSHTIRRRSIVGSGTGCRPDASRIERFQTTANTDPHRSDRPCHTSRLAILGMKSDQRSLRYRLSKAEIRSSRQVNDRHNLDSRGKLRSLVGRS